MFIDLPERSEAWHAHRQKFIGGSEIAALFGAEDTDQQIDPEDDEAIPAAFSDSLFSLHYIKSGTINPRPVDNEAVDAGIVMEPYIAAKVAERRGWQITKGRYAIDDTTAGLGASLDFEVVDAGRDADGVSPGGIVRRGSDGPLIGRGSLQIKNVRADQHRKKWVNDEPPLYVILQVQHELAASGLKWACIGAWVGGYSLRLYFYQRHEQIIAEIRDRVRQFWKRVEDKTPPAADGSNATSYALRQLYPNPVDNKSAPVDLSWNNELPTLCSEYQRLRDLRLAHKEVEGRMANRIKEIMGNHRYATCGDTKISISVTPEKEGRLPSPGELVGQKGEVRRMTVSTVKPSKGKK